MIHTIFFFNPLSWYQKNDVHLPVGKRVQRIDCTAKLVHAERRLVEHYDKLVIATAVLLNIPALDNIPMRRARHLKRHLLHSVHSMIVKTSSSRQDLAKESRRHRRWSLLGLERHEGTQS